MADELALYVIDNVEGLKRSESIGAGAYGVVCEVKVNGLPCIAKRLHDVLTNEQRVSQQERKAISERFRDECILLSRLRHPNIVQFLGVHYGRDRYDLTLVMERMHMDLETALEKFPNMSLPIKLRVLLDVSYGLLHLHCQTPPIVHRDFTVTNILLSPDMRAKVADLGVSKILDLSPQQFSKHTKCPGALAYMPPEALQQNPVYDVKLDIFSFGELALYTVNQQFPEVYELGPEESKAFRKGTAQLAKRKIAIDMMGKDHCLHQLVTTCLQDSPPKRPTTAQVNSTLQDLTTQQPVKDPHAINEKQKEQFSKEVEDLHEKLQVANEELEYHKGLVNSIVAVKQRTDASMQEAMHEAKMAFDEAKEYKRLADSLKQQMAQREKENLDLIQEMTRVSDELKVTKDQIRRMKAKNTKKGSTGKDSTPSPVLSPVRKKSLPGTVPEELYRRMEADYDQSMQDKTEIQIKLNEVTEAYEALAELLRTEPPLPQSPDVVSPIPKESLPPQVGKMGVSETPQYQPPDGRIPQQLSGASPCPIPPVQTTVVPAPIFVETRDLVSNRALPAPRTLDIWSSNTVPRTTSAGSQPPMPTSQGQMNVELGQEPIPQPHSTHTPIPQPHTPSPHAHSANAPGLIQHSTVISQGPPYHPPASAVTAPSSAAVSGDLSVMKGLDSDIRKAAAVVDPVEKKTSPEAKPSPTVIGGGDGGGGGSDDVIPFDPNLVCPKCRIGFRLGEIQKFRCHVNICK